MGLLITKKTKFDRYLWLEANRPTRVGDCREFPIGGKLAARLFEDEDEDNLALNVTREINMAVFGGLIKIASMTLKELLKDNVFSFVTKPDPETYEQPKRII